MEKFDYQKICSNLLKDLSPRTRAVLEERFGLKGKERKTLESIGNSYGLTRERIRQIEREGFSRIADEIEKYRKPFQYFKKVLRDFGGFRREKNLFDYLADSSSQNYLFFLLRANKDFQMVPESEDIYSAWTIDPKSINRAKEVIGRTIAFLEKQGSPLKLEKLFKQEKGISKKFFQSCLELSKKIQQNYEGEYGLYHWVTVNPRGLKDRAYLVLKNRKTPLHFKEITNLIKELPFSPPRAVQVATVHNELIRDERFVLVGRGLYALREWGYEPGVVKEVIANILRKSETPLSKQEILNQVLKQRFVKENTVSLNLNDKNYFQKYSDGRYTIREG